MNNPYKWNQINLDLVYGREKLISELLRALPSVNGSSFGINGARRIGKTTVLRLIERDLTEGKQVWADTGTSLVPIYIDGLVLPRPLSPELLWGHIFAEASAGLNVPCASTDEIDFREFRTLLQRLLQTQDRVPKLVVIFDEIEHITINDWATSFFANWRALLSNSPGITGYISAVFSGAREMESLQHDVGSPLMDVLEWRNLESLSLEDTRRLMTVPLGLEVDETCVSRVHAETGGHPMILQFVMQGAVAIGAPTSLEVLLNCMRNFEQTRMWQFGDWWVKYCDETGRRIYNALPNGGKPKKTSQISAEFGGYETSKAFAILQHVGIIGVSDDNSMVSRRCNMFERWHIEHITPEGTANSYDPTLANGLDAIDPDLRAKYVSAWEIFSVEMPNYSGAVSELRDVITLLIHRFAPDDQIKAQPWYSLEKDTKGPTRRQRITFLFGNKREQAKSIASEVELIEVQASQLTIALNSTYKNASALTHTVASRELAFTALKQCESLIAQLLLVVNGQVE